MPLTATDLLTPRGRLNGAALWPHLSVEDREAAIETYLDEGYAKAEVAALDAGDQDEPAKLWAYHRAYESAYERLLLSPSTIDLNDEGGSSFNQSQIDQVGDLADRALADYNALIVELGAEEEEGFGVIRSYR